MAKQKGLNRANSPEELVPDRKNRSRRSETRIVIEGSRDPATISAAIRDWIVPILVDRFMAENRQREARYLSTGTNDIPSLQ